MSNPNSRPPTKGAADKVEPTSDQHAATSSSISSQASATAAAVSSSAAPIIAANPTASAPSTASVNGSGVAEPSALAVPARDEKTDTPNSSDGKDDFYTMDEIAAQMEEGERLEEQFDALMTDVYGERCCTYDQGYIWQLVFTCKTCQPDDNTRKPAGICYHCMGVCHEGHEITRLYDKRAFRCDCGNSRFLSDTRCQLRPDKSAENPENRYNQNFFEKYCYCGRAYEEETSEEMLQCIVCQDWIHKGCLITPEAQQPADASEYAGFICKNCAQASFYTPLISQLLSKDFQPFIWKPEPLNSSAAFQPQLASSLAENKNDQSSSSHLAAGNETTSMRQKRRFAEISSEPAAVSVSEALNSTADACKRPHELVPTPTPHGEIFLLAGATAALCRCSRCQEEFNRIGLGFLLETDPREGKIRRIVGLLEGYDEGSESDPSDSIGDAVDAEEKAPNPEVDAGHAGRVPSGSAPVVPGNGAAGLNLPALRAGQLQPQPGQDVLLQLSLQSQFSEFASLIGQELNRAAEQAQGQIDLATMREVIQKVMSRLRRGPEGRNPE